MRIGIIVVAAAVFGCVFTVGAWGATEWSLAQDADEKGRTDHDRAQGWFRNIKKRIVFEGLTDEASGTCVVELGLAFGKTSPESQPRWLVASVTTAPTRKKLRSDAALQVNFGRMTEVEGEEGRRFFVWVKRSWGFEVDREEVELRGPATRPSFIAVYLFEEGEISASDACWRLRPV